VWGSLQRSPDSLTGLRRATFKREGRREDGKGGKGRDRPLANSKFLVHIDPSGVRGRACTASK